MGSVDKQTFMQGWRAFSRIHGYIIQGLEKDLQARHGLSMSEFLVLLTLSETDENKMRLQQLADTVGLSQSAMSRLAARLEAETLGAVERYICEADRRGVWIRLTDGGIHQCREALSTYEETLSNVLMNTQIKNEIPQAVLFLQVARTE